jgi:hypothetical protein
MSENPTDIAVETFQILKDEFPQFIIEIDESSNYTELEVSIPVQGGVYYEINLNLQNTDELHFNVDDFWGQWFPCTDPKIVDSYLSVVRGFLRGKYRIKVFSRKGKPYKRLLQSPKVSGGGWKIEYTHTSTHWPCFKPQIRYVRNDVDAH